ncbi:MAG: hypothetical protein AAF991_01065 [Pseudomonadota bacterium]
MENLAFILFFVVAAAFGRYLLAKARKKGDEWNTYLQALCEREGWYLSDVDPSRGPRSGIAISAPPENWRMSFHRIASGTTGTGSMNSGSRWTVWLDPSLALNQGVAVLGPAIPDKTREKTQQMLESSRLLSRVMLDAFVKGLDRKESLALRVIEDRFDSSRATLLASPGNEDVFDRLVGSESLEALAQFEGRIGNRPSLIRDRSGLQFRVERTLEKEEEILSFVEVGRAVSRDLAGTAAAQESES